METKYLIAEDVAIEEVKNFVDYHKEKSIAVETVKDDYENVIEAVRLGTLVFDTDFVPTYTLRKPVKNTDGGIALDAVTFRTRLRASDRERLAKGIDLEKDNYKLVNRFKAFFINQTVAMLDKFDSKFDESVINQVTSVFM